MVKNSCAAKAKHYSSLSVSSLKCSPHPTPSSWQHDWGCLPLSSPPGCNRLRARNRKKRFLEQGLSTASVRKCVDRWWKGAEAERQLNKSDKRIKQTRSQVEENRGGKEHCSSPAPKSSWTILVVWGTLPASLAVFGKECVWWLHLDTAELAMAPWPSTFGHTWRPPPSVNTQFPWLFSCLNLKTNKGNITKSQTDQAVIHDAVSILSAFLPSLYWVCFSQGHLLTSLHCISHHRFSTDVCRAQRSNNKVSSVYNNRSYSPPKISRMDTSAQPDVIMFIFYRVKRPLALLTGDITCEASINLLCTCNLRSTLQ